MIKGKKITLRLFAESDLEEYYKLTENVANKGEFYPLHVHSLQKLKLENNF